DPSQGMVGHCGHRRNQPPRSVGCSRVGRESRGAGPKANSPARLAAATLAGMGTLVLLRHGESEWNAKGLFTGWVDVPLAEKGIAEASASGRMLLDAGLSPGVVHTSVLTRAIQTANYALDAAGLGWLPVRRSWRLNERHYGALQGKNKAQTREEFGDE